MFVLVVTGPDGTRLRRPFVKHEVTLGRARDNDIALVADNVARRHARLVTRDDKHVLVILPDSGRTHVGGKLVTAPVIVTPGEPIEIGSFRIVIEAIDVAPVATSFEAADEMEATLL